MAVKRALLRPGDKIKIGIFELQVEDVAGAAGDAMDHLPTPALRRGAGRHGDDHALDRRFLGRLRPRHARSSGELKVDKRKALDAGLFEQDLRLHDAARRG